MNIFIRNLIFGVVILLLASCATVVAPDGGPVDTSPPIPLKYSPANGSLQMIEKKIIVEFDEFIVLDKVMQQMVVSPPMPSSPLVSVQGKKLIIELPDSLRHNTTYSIFLGQSILNYKERLPAVNFSYVFSTGNTLDSLELKGKAVNAFNHQAYQEVFIMLYASAGDSAVFKEKPYYLTKTSADGSFKFSNLAAGNYQLFALSDLNSNFIQDQPKEDFAFWDSLVNPLNEVSIPSLVKDSTADAMQKAQALDLFLFQARPTHTDLLSYKVMNPKKLLFTFNRDVDDLQLYPIGFEPDSTWYVNTYSNKRDTINTFLMGIDRDTLLLSLRDRDEILDTIRLILTKKTKLPESNRKSKNKATEDLIAPKPKAKPKITFQTNVQADLAFFSPILLRFSTPLNQFEPNRIQVFRAVDSLWIPMENRCYWADTLNKQKIGVEAKFDELSKYKLLIRDSAFFDLYFYTNDSLQKEFTTTEMRQYGSLKLDVQYDDQKPIIIQLLTEKENVLQEHFINKSQIIFYPYLPDGKYKLKLIYDDNGNHKWDNGDFGKRLQAERVSYIPSLIDIRANWDTEQTWHIE
jgi:uncharacterized protein (DUF2141 family)